jgi:hypothetical protein
MIDCMIGVIDIRMELGRVLMTRLRSVASSVQPLTANIMTVATIALTWP